MLCPTCGSDKIVNETMDVTTKVKYRIVTYVQEKTVCGDCRTYFFTPKQMDVNGTALKKAYYSAVN